MTQAQTTQNHSIRTTVKKTDADQIRSLVKGTGVFNEEEIDIAGELAEEALEQGEEKSGYSFIFREQEGAVIGYTCYGRIPFTEESYDLYWIAVDKTHQKAGLAREVLILTEQAVAKLGGKQLYAETSGTDHYVAARSFYLKNGFEEVARLKNFYKPGDDKVIFCKIV